MNRRGEAIKAGMELLARRSASAAEVKAHLLRKGFSGEETLEAASRLAEMGYLDDERFATDWASARAGAEGRAFLGAQGLRGGLIDRGVDPAVAARVSEALLPPEREAMAAVELARRRMRAYDGLDRETQCRRLWSYLARRGFRPDAIARALAETVKLEDDSLGDP